MTPESDQQRLATLRHYEILDTPEEDTFNIITAMLAEMLGVPHACVSLVDQERVWFKSAFGVEAREVPRESGFCSTLVASDETVRHIEDASQHPETRDNSLTCGAPHIRFYAGAPLCTATGHRIGTLCAFGPNVRDLTATERGSLANLARFVLHEIELRRANQELKRTEAALRQTQRLESVGMVASGVAHDFNNLLSGMLGAAELLRMELHGHATGQELVDNILTTGQRAADLVGQVLAYAGHSDDSPTVPNDFNALVRETVRMLSTSVETRVQIHLDLAEDLPAVPGQSTNLRQLVMNLLTNASEACGQTEGQVWLTTASSPGRDNVLFTVRDNGHGMTEDARGRIFEPFFSSKTGSRGLGLAICRRILEQHGASIEVESQVDRGTTFRVTLPACAESPSQQDAEPESRPEDQGQGRILVVDDEAIICEIVRRCLVGLGYEVVIARGGAEALEILECSPEDFGAVILDWNMPEMNGEQVLDSIQQRGWTLPIILSSGHTERAAQQRIGSHSVKLFLKKPYKLEQLVKAVQEAQVN